MVRPTRGSLRHKSLGNKAVVRKAPPPHKPKTVAKSEDDPSTDSDSSSDDEMDEIVSAALKNTMSAMAGDSNTTDTDSDGDDHSDSSCDDHSDSTCDDSHTLPSFIVDKGPDTQLMLVKGTVDLDRDAPEPSKDPLSDNGGDGSQGTSTDKNTECKGNVERKKTQARNRYELVTTLDPGIDMSDIYVNVNAFTAPQPSEKLAESRLVSQGDLLKGSVIDSEFEKRHKVLPYEESLHQLKKQRRAERAKTSGKGWFDMRVQEMTDAKKNDLMVLQMRRVLDPKRFYKSADRRALPKFFQMGRVVEGPADFYHSRIPKKQRKATLVDELLADAEFRKYNKRKYAEVVEQKRTSRGAYKHMKRLKKRKK